MPDEHGTAALVRGQAGIGPLLRSKLELPPPPPGLLPRPRLFALLDAGVQGPVTVVEAPAGWGKTVLLSSWVRERHPARAAWLSVEPGDTQPAGGRLWRYLCAALGAPVNGGGDAFLTRLAAALAGRSEPVVLVLDDFHHVADDTVPRGLEFLLRHAPGALRLVLASRTEPPLALHRWRVRGEVAELRAGQLSFTDTETEQVLARAGLALPPGQLAELQARTEGWPAGVRLAARALHDQPDPVRLATDLTGDTPPVADYLVAEVLADQPGEVRDLLLCTSILRRVSADSIEALTGRTDGERVLAGLRHADGYVVPLDARRHSYRHHRMFGEMLRAELHRQAPERVPELHRRAAHWYAAHDLPRDALRHALLARDWGQATAVLADGWADVLAHGGAGGSQPEPGSGGG
ncbi:MAG TPA: AAA family ATPase, partial [Rugosimonospora sp.]|nr:AAA family ATPase [Rugosimonospora sp.]